MSDDVAYWNAEALNDPRYAAGAWGMTAEDDAKVTLERIVRILDRGMPPRDGVVLEIGCGPGRILLEMADRYGDAAFYGVDISEEMLAICQRRMDQLALDNVLLWSQFWAVPDCTGPPDLVYCVELFQHLPDAQVQNYINQAWDALGPGGKFIAQFVVRGEPGPHSFPRDHQQIAFMYGAPWSNLSITEGAVHEDWSWVTATKPATS